MGLRLEAEIALNSATFERGMSRVKDSVLGTVKAYALGAIGVYSLERAFSATIETARELTDNSKRLGVTVEQLQVMRKAANNTGVEFEALAKAMDKVNEFRAGALKVGGDSNVSRMTAAQLGVTPDMLKNMSAQDILFGPIAKKIAQVNPQEIMKPLRDMLGRSASEVIPALTQDVHALQKQMESLGMIMSGETARDLMQIDIAAKSIQNIFINALAPAIVGVVKMFLGLLTSGGFFTEALDDIIFYIRKITHGDDKKVYGMDQATASAASSLLADAVKGVSEKTFPEVLANLRKNGAEGTRDLWGADVPFTIGPEFMDNFKGSTLREFNKFIESLRLPELTSVDDASKTSSDLITGLKKVLDDLNEPVPKPKKPDFKAAPQETHMRLPDDSLIKVGNFLGSSRGMIGGAQARLEQHAAQTAVNTGLIVQLLKNPPGGEIGQSKDSLFDAMFPQ
jgi:hypothetical protein